MLCESRPDHVLLMKKAVEVPFKELVEGPAPDLKIEEICEVSDDGISIRRVYVNTDDDHPFAEVGWVHNEDVNACLSCSQEFGFFRWKHHCRTCGLLVCGECTSTALILGHSELGEQTVCNKCFGKATPLGVPLSAETVWGTEVYRSPDRPVQQDVVEVRAAPTSIQADPTEGFVIEVRRNSESADRVYINVFHNPTIRDFYRVLTNNGHASSVSGTDNRDSTHNLNSTQNNANMGTKDTPEEEVEQVDFAPDGISALTAHTIHTTHTNGDKVTPLVYVYGPCSLQDSAEQHQHYIYNVLVSSAYFDSDLIRDDTVLITHNTSVNKIIQVVNRNFNEHLNTTSYTLPVVPLRYLGGVPPKDAYYTRSSCSVYNVPAHEICCVSDQTTPTTSPSTPYTLSGFSTRYSSRKDTEFDRFSLGLFSSRVSPAANVSLKEVAAKAPGTLLGCEIIYPYDTETLPAEADQTLLHIVTHTKHSPMRGTWFRICNVQTKKSKWVRLKRGPHKSGVEFFITRKYLGSPKDYGLEKTE